LSKGQESQVLLSYSLIWQSSQHRYSLVTPAPTHVLSSLASFCRCGIMSVLKRRGSHTEGSALYLNPRSSKEYSGALSYPRLPLPNTFQPLDRPECNIMQHILPRDRHLTIFLADKASPKSENDRSGLCRDSLIQKNRGCLPPSPAPCQTQQIPTALLTESNVYHQYLTIFFGLPGLGFLTFLTGQKYSRLTTLFAFTLLHSTLPPCGVVGVG
jgi:hypothetical protein